MKYESHMLNPNVMQVVADSVTHFGTPSSPKYAFALWQLYRRRQCMPLFGGSYGKAWPRNEPLHVLDIRVHLVNYLALCLLAS